MVKTTILLKDIKDFQAVNEVYAQCFTNNLPSRMAFQVNIRKMVRFGHLKLRAIYITFLLLLKVAALPKDGLVEIEVVAKIGVLTVGCVTQSWREPSESYFMQNFLRISNLASILASEAAFQSTTAIS